MELSELIRQVLVQMFKNSLKSKDALEKVDNNVLYYIGKVCDNNEQGKARRNGDGGTVGR